jgi:hypothetical protein
VNSFNGIVDNCPRKEVMVNIWDDFQPDSGEICEYENIIIINDSWQGERLLYRQAVNYFKRVDR